MLKCCLLFSNVHSCFSVEQNTDMPFERIQMYYVSDLSFFLTTDGYWLKTMSEKKSFKKRVELDKSYTKPRRTACCGLYVLNRQQVSHIPLDFKCLASIKLAQCVRNKQPTLVIVSAWVVDTFTPLHTHIHTHLPFSLSFSLSFISQGIFFSPALSPTPSPLPSFHIKY